MTPCMSLRCCRSSLAGPVRARQGGNATHSLAHTTSSGASTSGRSREQCQATSDRWVVQGGVVVAAAALLLIPSSSALAMEVEPSNALSLPTWAIHVSSVVEWVTAMGLFWKYAEVTGNQRWKGMTWGMLPSLGSAMCACTWHFFYNAPSLEFLVAVQAALTVVGNATCGIAAYRVYDGAVKEKQAS
ncbi:hypothetical protein FOA52_005934 [Chlamydomonas sp. UWO 241]|nr:hypothetical protein FOA52_005934 [Chlamydomonas sp. UWO 241]